uniref:CULLIN_2 domain-containing protein n=1 Tax=Parastrongyloides trichosuri TaxID=131310 RepID=A0A0N4Z462_PARTI
MFSKSTRGIGIDDNKSNILSIKGSRITRPIPSILKKSDNSPTNNNSSKEIIKRKSVTTNKGVTIVDNLKNSDRTKSLTNLNIPKCPHSSTKQIEDYTFLQDAYVQNLQQQIQLLEMENNYLKNSKDEVKSNSNEIVMMEGKNTNNNVRKREKEKVVENVDNNSTERYHVFEDDEISIALRDVDDSSGGRKFNYTSPRQLSPKQRTYQRIHVKSVNETNLETKIYKLESKLSQKNAEINELLRIKSELEDRIYDINEKISKKEEQRNRDRHTLMDENILLQKRLDDLTPILSQKESSISRLEADKDNLMIKIRSLQQECKNLHIKYDEKEKEKMAFSELENRRRNEIERLFEKIKEYDNENMQLKLNEQSYIDQLTVLRRRMMEEELKNKKDKSLSDKILDDNNNLIKENSRLTSQIMKLEMIIEQQDKELSKKRDFEIQEQEFMESRQRELNLRNDLRIKEENIIELKDKISGLETKLKDKDIHIEKDNEEKKRIQNELEGLNVLSKSLSSENKTLRENKNGLEDKVKILENKISDKEVEISKLKEEKDDMKLRHYEALEKMRKEIFLHSEKTNEFENLVKRIRDLSDTATKLQSREGSTIRSISILSPHVSFDSEPKQQTRSIYSLREASNISEESTTSLGEKINSFSEMLKYRSP